MDIHPSLLHRLSHALGLPHVRLRSPPHEIRHRDARVLLFDEHVVAGYGGADVTGAIP